MGHGEFSARVDVGGGEGRPDVVLESGCHSRSVREVQALGIVFFGGYVEPAAENIFPEVGERVDGGCTLDQRLEWGCG